MSLNNLLKIFLMVCLPIALIADTWEYEDAKGNWTEYSKPIVYLFEAAYMVGLSSIKFKDDKKELFLDLAKKVQTTKTGRGVKSVHRIKATDASKLILTVFLLKGNNQLFYGGCGNECCCYFTELLTKIPLSVDANDHLDLSKILLITKTKVIYQPVVQTDLWCKDVDI